MRPPLQMPIRLAAIRWSHYKEKLKDRCRLNKGWKASQWQRGKTKDSRSVSADKSHWAILDLRGSCLKTHSFHSSSRTRNLSPKISCNCFLIRSDKGNKTNSKLFSNSWKVAGKPSNEILKAYGWSINPSKRMLGKILWKRYWSQICRGCLTPS